MEKRQRYPKTVGTAIKVTDPTNTTTEGTDFENLNTTLKNLSDGMLTDAQKNYLDAQIQKDLASKVAIKCEPKTVAGTLSYNADETASSAFYAELEVRVYLYLNGVKQHQVDVGNISGWTKKTEKLSDDVTYTYYACTLDSSKTSVNAVSISYTVKPTDSETYAGITASTSTDRQAFSVNYPVYYGLYGSKTVPSGDNQADEMNAILTNTHFTKAYNSASKGSITNNTSESMYIWMVCRNSANAQQVGQPALDDNITTGVSIKSTVSGSSIVLTGYKVYKVRNSLGAGVTADFSTFTLS